MSNRSPTLLPGRIYPVFNINDSLVKEKLYNDWIYKKLAQLEGMFTFKNLPEHIKPHWVNYYTFVHGKSYTFKLSDGLHQFYGANGGQLDENFYPKTVIITNPYLPELNGHHEFKLGDEAVVLHNDDYDLGVMPIIEKYAALLTENELTLKVLLTVSKRANALITGVGSSGKSNADLFINHLIDGDYASIEDKPDSLGIKVNPLVSSNVSPLTEFIELEQYLSSRLWNELGVNANFNMKRESIDSNESDLNTHSLFPFVDVMFKCRKEWADAVNEKWGTDISVELNSSWLDERRDSDVQNRKDEAEVKLVESEVEQKEGESDEFKNS